VADVIVALEGPIALTACIEHTPGECDIEALCPARANWQRINSAIREALEGITLMEMAQAVPAAFGVSMGEVAGRGRSHHALPAMDRRAVSAQAK
jgi:DNA-binding IscR family transcriptional regulator